MFLFFNLILDWMTGFYFFNCFYFIIFPCVFFNQSINLSIKNNLLFFDLAFSINLYVNLELYCVFFNQLFYFYPSFYSLHVFNYFNKW